MNSYFQFKQFTIHHDRCAMKVGTDGVLIGAWAPSIPEADILDIGCGSGLITLMMAQRYPISHVTAVEIDSEATIQARENISNTPFAQRIEVINADFNKFHFPEGKKYQTIVSNPPYFEETLGTLASSPTRINARHTESLSFEDLITNSASLLADNGQFSVIIPYTSASTFISICAIHGLYLSHRCDVRNSSTKQFKRTLLTFTTTITNTIQDVLTLRTSENKYTTEYQQLTKEFYL